MSSNDEWYQIAIGNVISQVKQEAATRLLNEFGITAEDVLDEIRIDAMQNADRKSDSYRIFIRRRALDRAAGD